MGFLFFVFDRHEPVGFARSNDCLQKWLNHIEFILIGAAIRQSKFVSTCSRDPDENGILCLLTKNTSIGSYL